MSNQENLKAKLDNLAEIIDSNLNSNEEEIKSAKNKANLNDVNFTNRKDSIKLEKNILESLQKDKQILNLKDSKENQETNKIQEKSIYMKFVNNLDDLLYGLGDSLQIFNIFTIIKSSERILINLRNCILLNGLIMISSNIFFFYFLEPFMNNCINSYSNFSYFISLGKYIYCIFWLIPIFLVCNILTAFWIDEIYYDSLEYVEKTKSINIEGLDLMTSIANQIQRQLIVLSYILSINLLNIFLNLFSSFSPILSTLFFIVKFFAMSVLNSLYVFEYILLQKYLKNFKNILYFIENKIFYFFGFGILLTILINFIDSVTISSALFLILFPFFLIASVKINNKRFSNQREIKIGKLRFFSFIEFVHSSLLNLIFRIFKLKSHSR